MYYAYFGVDQPPFKITPDTRLFYPGGNRGVVLDALIYAITNGEGITKVVGEVGSGKTMLSRMLAQELPEDVEIVYIANPSLTPDNILHAIAFELKLDVAATAPRHQVMQKLQEHLLEKHAQNRRVVMFVEEAQSMPVDTLEEIRLLSNLETQEDKLLQIVLFGQPELDENLSKQNIRQLRERITFSFKLAPLEEEQVRDYINSRLRSCGYRGSALFTRPAIRLLTAYSAGLLRRINILADKALLAAFSQNAKQVRIGHVRLAGRDSEFRASRLVSRYAWRAGAAVAVVLAVGVWAWMQSPWMAQDNRKEIAVRDDIQESGQASTADSPTDGADHRVIYFD
jgi:type II secretory pathway predicted ATPase ExeA